ncbi:hypothetical protein EDD17DRAFT_1512889 [Pisolithus thermaeus]|nr:hypothetical protein EDD17DRAFT_1512889 [Pisolithus thermaeus]
MKWGAIHRIRLTFNTCVRSFGPQGGMRKQHGDRLKLKGDHARCKHFRLLRVGKAVEGRRMFSDFVQPKDSVPRPKLTVKSTRVRHVVDSSQRDPRVPSRTTVYKSILDCEGRLGGENGPTSTLSPCSISIHDSAPDQGDAAYLVHAHSVRCARACRMVPVLLMTTFNGIPHSSEYRSTHMLVPSSVSSTVHALLEEHWKKEHSITLKNVYHVRAAFLRVEEIQYLFPEIGVVDISGAHEISSAIYDRGMSYEPWLCEKWTSRRPQKTYTNPRVFRYLSGE